TSSNGRYWTRRTSQQTIQHARPRRGLLGSKAVPSPRRFVRPGTRKGLRLQAFRRADDGTRTHDLLHGKCERCSRPFAQVRSNRLFAASSSERANPTEPERTPNLAILATPRAACALTQQSIRQPSHEA